MTGERRRFNRKRRIRTPRSGDDLAAMARAVSYGGNPEHKRDPGDFGLVPPAQPRPDKTLCDGAGIFRGEEAEALLREGVRRGLVSEQVRGDGFPQNVWAVTQGGTPLEAQLENTKQGIYHGYPMPEADPFREVVLRRWREGS